MNPRGQIERDFSTSTFADPNATFTFAKSVICIHFMGEAIDADAEVQMRLLPLPRVEIVTTFSSSKNSLGGGSVTEVALIDPVLSLPGFPTNVQSSLTNDGSKFTLNWLLNASVDVAGDKSTKLTSVVFGIVNLRDFHSSNSREETRGTAKSAIFDLSLLWREFKLTISSFFDTSSRVNKLKDIGGFVLTHSGDVTQTDGKPFDVSYAENLLLGFNFCLSFSTGISVSHVLPVGCDSAGNRLWESWFAPWTSYYISPRSWTGQIEFEMQLQEFFPKFMDKWDDLIWREALREAIYWYLNSNYSSRGIDAGIIIVHTALERLSYTYIVESSRLLSKQGYNDLASADRLRMLFGILNIPTTIPSACVDLLRSAKEFNWNDSPQALSEIRNEQVHPQHKKRGAFGDCLYDAWNLGLWYVELSILAICGYDGGFRDRVSGVPLGFSRVPWRQGT